MAKITVDTETNSVKTARDLVVEPATGSDAGAVAPARAIQYNGVLISSSNRLPVDVNFPANQAISDAGIGSPADASASTDSANAGLVSLVKRLLVRLTFLFQGSVGNPNTNVVTVQGISGGQIIPVFSPPPSTVVTGQKTVTATGLPVPLGTATGLMIGVTIKPLSGNTGKVFITATNSTTGFELKPGESTIVFVSRLDVLNISSEINGEGVCYHGS